MQKPPVPTKPPAPENRGRDRAATEAALVAAARAVLAEEGFVGLGINAVARRAGCDKQLIYRYFGGLDGLVDAIGNEIGDDLRRSLQPLAALGQAGSYRELVERMMLGFLQALRDDALMRRIMAWEIASPSELVQRLTRARSKSMMAWVAESRGTLVPPAGVDVAATNAVLLAAIQHLVLSSAAAGQFAGLTLTSEADWERVRAVVKAIVAGAYAG
ncbi:MAG: TetR/AcrR family transcriptional regulator [Mesorhizobium sp.]|nr:TetR/AcrR family transcriptional regulator [Mesorhizobium sp.]